MQRTNNAEKVKVREESLDVAADACAIRQYFEGNLKIVFSNQ